MPILPFNTIQVSTSCSSVYVDGTETEGSSNASIVIKYGSNSGLARFTVWMPEYPLEVAVTDFRLSQIKGWKIPVDAKKYAIINAIKLNNVTHSVRIILSIILIVANTTRRKGANEPTLGIRAPKRLEMDLTNIHAERVTSKHRSKFMHVSLLLIRYCNRFS